MKPYGMRFLKEDAQEEGERGSLEKPSWKNQVEIELLSETRFHTFDEIKQTSVQNKRLRKSVYDNAGDVFFVACRQLDHVEEVMCNL